MATIRYVAWQGLKDWYICLERVELGKIDPPLGVYATKERAEQRAAELNKTID